MADVVRPSTALKAEGRDWTERLFGFYRTSVGREVLNLVFLLAVLMVVVRSVEAAHWVSMPSLTLTMFLSVLAGYAAARSPWRGARAHWAVIPVGAIVVYVQVASLVSATSWIGRFSTMHSRLADWGSAVVGEDASTDLLPFAIMLTAFTWIVGYLATWVILKRHTIWLVIIPTALGLIANLSWLPGSFLAYLIAYVAAVMLLTAHTNALRHEESLKGSTAQPSGKGYLTTMGHALWAGALVLIIAMAMPARGWTNGFIKEVSVALHQPIETLRAEFARAFSVPSKTPTSLRFFGSVLPIQRQIPQGEDPIFMTRERMPTYWPIKAYSDYTSTAWRLEDIQTGTLEGVTALGSLDIEELVASGSLSLVDVDLMVDTPYFFLPHGLLTLNRKARVESHEAKVYTLNAARPEENRNLPPELRQWAEKFGLGAASDQVFQELAADASTSAIINRVTLEKSSGEKGVLARTTSYDEYLDKIGQELARGGRLLSLDVQRNIPPQSDILAFKPEGWMRAGEFYSFEADLATPSEPQLVTTTGEYPVWVLDRYLTLPKDLPQRVKDLAVSLTKDVPTQYEKATVIEDYLRTYEYQPYPPPLAPDADAVDQFLFDTKVGYSDYFASSMAVMLRVLRIPSRVVVGYNSGQLDQELDAYVVKDKDSHTWPEVYFANVGWVEFEPTPIYPKRPRGTAGDSTLDFSISALTEEATTSEEETASAAEKKPVPVPGRLPGGRGLFPSPLLEFGNPLGRDGVIFLVTLGALSVAMWLLWRRRFIVLYNAEDAYLQLHRISSFLGIKVSPSKTPFEFARMLASIVPQARQEIDLICETFVKRTYGKQRLTARDRFMLFRAWRTTRNRLLRELVSEKNGAKAP